MGQKYLPGLEKKIPELVHPLGIIIILQHINPGAKTNSNSYDIFSNCPYSVILNHIDSRYISTMSSRYFPGMVFYTSFYTCCAFF